MDKVIHVGIRNKIADQMDKTVYVCGNSDYTVEFDFDAEWDEFDAKTARFIAGSSYTDVVFTGNVCDVPVIENTYSIKVGVFAGNLHTTTPAVISSKKSILCENGTPAPPTEDVYNQIMEKIGELQADVPQEQIAAAVAEYLEENPVGGVTPEELTQAVNTALKTAKDSGEFDGPAGATGPQGPAGADGKDGAPGADGAPGKDGVDGAPGKDGSDGAPGADGEDGGYYTPDVDSDGNLTWTASKAGMPTVSGANIKGPAGANGKDYVLTEADKQEIAGMVEVTGGGANIDDTTPSTSTTYSSSKIEAELSELNEAKANNDDLASVAQSGSYNDLSDKPTIPTVPSALPNPNALTFTGAVTAEYDGSAPVSVEIPEGGYTLPIASPTTLGGVKAAAKTDEMTQAVGVDAEGKLWGEPGGGDSSVWAAEVLAEGTIPAETPIYTWTPTGLSLADLAKTWKVFQVELYCADQQNSWNVGGYNFNKHHIGFIGNARYAMFAFFIHGKDRNRIQFASWQSGSAGNYMGSYCLTGEGCNEVLSYKVGYKTFEDDCTGMWIRNYGAATTAETKWRVTGVIKWEE